MNGTPCVTIKHGNRLHPAIRGTDRRGDQSAPHRGPGPHWPGRHPPGDRTTDRSRARRRDAARGSGDRDGLPRGWRIRPIARWSCSPHAAVPRRVGPDRGVRSRRPAHPCRHRDVGLRCDRPDPSQLGHRARARRDTRRGDGDDRRAPGPERRRAGVGRGGRRARTGRLRHRAARGAADHARLERVRRAPPLRAAVRRPGLGRQRREPPRPRRPRPAPARGARPGLLQGRYRHRSRAALGWPPAPRGQRLGGRHRPCARARLRSCLPVRQGRMP